MSINNAHSLLTSVLRGGRGWFASPTPRQPEQPIELYEFESCPYCRKVREVFSELDIDYVCRTTGRGATTKRAFVASRGGKTMFPYMIDPNTNTEMYESEDIITYLHDTYGDGRSILSKAASPFNTATSAIASASRPFGGRVRKGLEGRAQPEHLLVLYSFEISPYCRKVRECLISLNLDYQLHNVAKNGKRRAELVERGGKMMVPYLIDPNTGTEMYESDDIVAYLERTYGTIG